MGRQNANAASAAGQGHHATESRETPDTPETLETRGADRPLVGSDRDRAGAEKFTVTATVTETIIGNIDGAKAAVYHERDAWIEISLVDGVKSGLERGHDRVLEFFLAAHARDGIVEMFHVGARAHGSQPIKIQPGQTALQIAVNVAVAALCRDPST